VNLVCQNDVAALEDIRGGTPAMSGVQRPSLQRWTPEELLRTLVEAGISARDEANLRARLCAAAFPVRKSVEEFKVAESPCRKLPSTTSPRFELGRPTLEEGGHRH
jgi:hypothetical protein